MKRLLTSLSALFLALSLFAQGIGGARDLVNFINAYNSGADVSMYKAAGTDEFVFTADIDLTKEKKVPQLHNFAGRLDGRGYRIIGWKGTASFIDEILDSAEVRGVIFDKSCSIKASSKSSVYMLGMLAGKNSGIVSDCENHGSIVHKCTYTSNPVYIGGLVGSNNYCMLRCRNYGTVSTVTTGVQQKADLTINLGGIFGGVDGKSLLGTVVAWCENHGGISAGSDFPAESIGGIAGGAGKCPLKYCVNYGTVKSSSVRPEESPLRPQSRIGGVAGLTKGDIACCDNRGIVLAEGFAQGYAGGIVGQPHSELNVSDCVNYGSVTAECENVCFVGGIAGNVGRPVHFRRCINRGEVSFGGVSARERSCAAGIVGQIYCPKSTDKGTYVRNCVNFGKVVSSAGGNNFGNNDHAIHTAGIVGYMEAREGFVSYLYDCSNEGQIVSAGGRKGAICGSAKNIRTGGSMPDDDAVKAEVLPDGTNVRGRVTYSDGTPAADVVVTDGRLCTATDVNGYYSMKSDLDEAHFIYLSIPSYAMTSTYSGIPQFFRRVSRDDKAVEANFSLEKTERSDKYTLLMIGDPQVRPAGVDNSMERWTDTVSIDAEQFRSTCTGGVYCINLGDLVYNFMTAYDDYIDAASQINCPTFNVIGNHDFDQTTLFDTALGNMYFETYISPEHYSFNIGRIHFVVVNTIMYDRKKADDRYGYGLDERTMRWLENDLRYVPEDRVIVACSHGQLFKKRGDTPNGSHGALQRNYKEYRELLSRYREVYSWSGHYHHNFQYNYSGRNEKWGAENIQCITVSRCTGALRLNEYLNSDGTPQGYMVVNVDGDNLDWWYKPVGKGKDCQMKVYDPSRSGEGYVQANIWNYGDCWTTPEWWENGVKVADMEYHPGTDPDYVALYATVTNKKTRKYCTPSESSQIFRVKPSEGSRGGEVHVKDQFGNEFVSSVAW